MAEPAGTTAVAEPDATASTPEPGGRRRSRPWVLVGALVLAGALFGGVAWWIGDNGEDPARETLPPLGDAASLDPDRQALLALLESARGRTVHAVYEESGGSRIEVWRAGDRTRTDTTVEGPDGPLRVVTIHTPEEDVSCQQSAGGPWACQPSEAQATFEQAVAGELALRDVEATEPATIAGREARCFTISGEGDSIVACVDEEGLILRIASEAARIELVSADTDVSDDDFVPPA